MKNEDLTIVGYFASGEKGNGVINWKLELFEYLRLSPFYLKMNIFQRSQGGIAMHDKNCRIILCVVLTAVSVILLKLPAISGQHFKPRLVRIPPIIPESDLGKGKFLVARKGVKSTFDPYLTQFGYNFGVTTRKFFFI